MEPNHYYLITDAIGSLSDHQGYKAGTVVWITDKHQNDYYTVTDGVNSWYVDDGELLEVNTVVYKGVRYPVRSIVIEGAIYHFTNLAPQSEAEDIAEKTAHDQEVDYLIPSLYKKPIIWQEEMFQVYVQKQGRRHFVSLGTLAQCMNVISEKKSPLFKEYEGGKAIVISEAQGTDVYSDDLLTIEHIDDELTDRIDINIA